jgi:hypothetical protein
MRLVGRRVHLAGSAAPSTSTEGLDYAHDVVRSIATELASRGATFVAQVGKEPRAVSGGEPGSAIIFDWTLLEVLGAALRDGSANAAGPTGKLLASVCTHKTEAQIPADRRPLWEEFLAADAVRVEHIEGDWTSGAVRRERQAQIGDVLIAVSGGEGVEHLAQLYAGNGKPVIPLDLNIGSSSGDGKGGASWLNKEALSHPDDFFRLADPSSGVAHLTAAGTRNGQTDATQVAQAVCRLLNALRGPEAFYVRLLNPKVDSFTRIEDFFRNVVDPVINELGYAKAEMGEVPADQAFMNVEIFDRIHHAAIAVVDLTGLRHNCMMELGYAFGRLKRVILTAEEGTDLPFDPGAIETHFWDPAADNKSRIARLLDYCGRTATRPPLVKPRGWTS